MDITFRLPHVFSDHANDLENSIALKILLKCLVDLNRAFIRSCKRNKITVKSLYTSGTRYVRGKVWLPIPELYKIKKGDCKSLAAALVAEYLEQGIECRPVFRFQQRADGSMLYHILVEVPNKNGYEKKLYEDPSKRLGMNQDEWSIV